MTPEEARNYDTLERMDAHATCRTPDCENQNTSIAVSVLAPPHETAVVCGACGEPITDIVKDETP